MRRAEHYCDRCGAQMTVTSTDGDTDRFGVVLKEEINIVHATHTAVTDQAKTVFASVSYSTPGGSSGFAKWLRGVEFCSYECLEVSVLEWLAEVKCGIPHEKRGKVK